MKSGDQLSSFLLQIVELERGHVSCKKIKMCMFVENDKTQPRLPIGRVSASINLLLEMAVT